MGKNVQMGNDQTVADIVSHMGSGMLDTEASTMALVCLAIRHGALVWDQDRAEGKGGWIGGAPIVRKVIESAEFDERDRVAREFTAGRVSKVATVVRSLAAHTVASGSSVADGDLYRECRDWLAGRTLSGLYNDLKGDDDAVKVWSLSGALAAVVAKARKEGIEDSLIVETLVSILEGQ